MPYETDRDMAHDEKKFAEEPDTAAVLSEWIVMAKRRLERAESAAKRAHVEYQERVKEAEAARTVLDNLGSAQKSINEPMVEASTIDGRY